MNFECPTSKFLPSLFEIQHSVFDISDTSFLNLTTLNGILLFYFSLPAKDFKLK
jgi:hypothetical protein